MRDANSSPMTEPSPALVRDLSLVLPEPRTAGDVDLQAHVEGRRVDLTEGVAQASALIDACRAPAIVGLNELTVEATREAVALADRLQGRLLPWPVSDAIVSRQTVTQTATLAEVYDCELVIWVGFDDETSPSLHPLIQAVEARVKQCEAVNNQLDTVFQLRDALRRADEADPLVARILREKRVAALLAPSCDPRVASQWHRLAGELQQRVRLCVLSTPAPKAWRNLTGVLELITWQTGLSCAAGGVDFADGAPRACPDAGSLLNRGAIDLAIVSGQTSGMTSSTDERRVIQIGPELNPDAAVSFVTPGLALGLAARVIRFDGIVLWLCDDPSSAPTDPAVELFTRLRGQA